MIIFHTEIILKKYLLIAVADFKIKTDFQKNSKCLRAKQTLWLNP